MRFLQLYTKEIYLQNRCLDLADNWRDFLLAFLAIDNLNSWFLLKWSCFGRVLCTVVFMCPNFTCCRFLFEVSTKKPKDSTKRIRRMMILDIPPLNRKQS